MDDVTEPMDLCPGCPDGIRCIRSGECSQGLSPRMRAECARDLRTARAFGRALDEIFGARLCR